MKKSESENFDIQTRLAHLASRPESYNGVVNPPVHRASTIIIDNFEDFKNCFNAPYRYGREGTPSSKAFEYAITQLDGGYNAIATSSGLAAIICVLNAYAESGAEFLLPDNLYGFARQYCQETLSKFGVKPVFYDPLIDENGLETLISDKTALLYLESPGSLTYEVQDIAMIVNLAKKHGLPTACDNSWATPLNFRPFDHGIDISIMSATKYISGHSDAMLGVISCSGKAVYDTILPAVRQAGNCPGSEEVYLGLRGLRTLEVRLNHHAKSGLYLAHWLSTHPAVKKVLCPALKDDPGHENFKKYFIGNSGVFAILLDETDCDKIERFLNALEIFQIGFSWGGYESLVFPEQLNKDRISKPWQGDGFLLRIHAGLENAEDLKSDLAQALDRLA